MPKTQYSYGTSQGMQIDVLIRTLEQEFTEYDLEVRRAERRAADRFERDAVVWMQQNRKWQDRTGEARRLLRATIYEGPDELVLELEHGVDYGRFLELNYGGKFSILIPAAIYWEPKWGEYMEKEIGYALR